MSNEHNKAHAVPQGWKWVPVEPTPDMEGAGRVNMAYGSCTARQVWSAMLAATPAAPSQEPTWDQNADVCKGAWSLGTACGECAKCIATKPVPEPVTLTDEVLEPIVKAIWDSGFAACRDTEIVGTHAQELAWGCVAANVIDKAERAIIAALREKEGK